jgi:hypothetical protein
MSLLNSGSSAAAAFGPSVRRLTAVCCGRRAASIDRSPIMRHVTLLMRIDLGAFACVCDAVRTIAVVGAAMGAAGELAFRVDTAPGGAADLRLLTEAVGKACPTLARLRLSASTRSSSSSPSALLGALAPLPATLTSLSVSLEVDLYCDDDDPCCDPLSLPVLKHVDVDITASPSMTVNTDAESADTVLWLEAIGRTLLKVAVQVRTVSFTHAVVNTKWRDTCVRMTPSLARTLFGDRASIISLRLPMVRVVDRESALALFGALPFLSTVCLRSLEGADEFLEASAPRLRHVNVAEGHRHSVKLQPNPLFLRPMLAALLRFAPDLQQFSSGTSARIVRIRPFLEIGDGQSLWRAEFMGRNGDAIGIII